MKYLVENNKTSRTAYPVDTFFKSIAVTTFSPYHQNIFKPRIFAFISEVEITGILQETQSTQSSEYSSGYPDGPEMQ